MKKRFYIAYGSNLNMEQMLFRCPTARAVGTSELEGWRLLFKGSKSGYYLTIEPDENSSVPVGVWEVTEEDEARLDRFEGVPSCYYKKELMLNIKGIKSGKFRRRRAFAYIMHEDRHIGIPSLWYMQTCLEGYDTFYFNKNTLMSAYKKCKRLCENEG